MTTEKPLPACITRDNLTSPYWPSLSFAGLASIVTLNLIFMLASFNRLNHTDLWGHVNFGRWMAENQALPAADPFAAEPTATPVLQSAWLAQRLGYEVERLFGNEGLILGHALLVTLTAGTLMLAAYRRGAPALWAWSAGLAMFVLDLPIVGTIRPQLFGQLGAALFLLACVELPARKHPLMWLPLVAGLWANLHGSIVMGLAILVIFAAGTTWQMYQQASGQIAPLVRDRRLLVAWGALLIAAAAACIGPHGPLLLLRTLFFNEHAALASISEWRALTPRSLTGILMIVSVAATAALVKFSPRKWSATEILLLLVFGLAVLPAIRMLAWWAVVWPWVAVPHAAAAWRKYQCSRHAPRAVTDQRHTECAYYYDEGEPNAMRTVLAMGFVFMTLIIAPPTYAIVAGRGRGDGPSMVTDAPLYVADEAVRRGLAGSIAAPMDWADYLVWQTNGQLKPLVYSHVHLTDIGTWRDYESIFRGDEDWLNLLQTHQMRYLLVPRSRYAALTKLVLVEDRNGKGTLQIVYQDQRCLLAEILPPAQAEESVEESPVVPTNAATN